MGKTIKFNLHIDGVQIRNIEDLKYNFNIQDILDYYHSGLLYKWLKVRGLELLSNEILKVETSDELEIAKILIQMFEIETDKQTIEEQIYSLRYERERQIQFEEYRKNGFNVQQIIDDYHQGYMGLVNDLIERKDDLPFIKSAIHEIVTEYKALFRLNARFFYEMFIEKGPLVIFAVLLNENSREVFLTHEYIKEEVPKIAFNNNVLEQLGEHLKTFSGVTDNYWRDLEPAEKKIMVVSIVNGNFVRGLGNVGEQLSSSDVNGKFVLLNGLNYMSNNDTHLLKYMEV